MKKDIVRLIRGLNLLPFAYSLCQMGQKNWSRVNFVTIFGDLYKIKLWDIGNNFNKFTHLSFASGPRYDVLKMAVIAHL